MGASRVFLAFAWVLSLSLSVGCGSSTNPPADGGIVMDGGTPLDGGVAADGGAVDGGVSTDGGTSADGGAVTLENETVDTRTNDTFATAQMISVGQTIHGTIGNLIVPDNDDVDIYRFPSQQYGVYEVAVRARSGSDYHADFEVRDGLGDYLRVGVGGDNPGETTRQFFVTVGGDLYVVVLDTRNLFPSEHLGGATYTYELTIRKATLNVTQVNLPTLSRSDAIDAQGRLAVFSFQGTAGQKVRAETRAMRLNPPSDVDTWLLLVDQTNPAAPSVLANNDDIEVGVNRDSYVEATLNNSGLHYVIVDFWIIEGDNHSFEIDIQDPALDGGTSAGTAVVTGIIADGQGGALAGARVWVPDGDPSASTTTDQRGAYSLVLPVGATVFVRAAKEGFQSAQRGIVVPAAGAQVPINLTSRETINTVMSTFGLTPDPTKGAVVLTFIGDQGVSAGGFGATLSQAHQVTIAIGGSGPVLSSETVAGGRDLIFGGVETGTTSVNLVATSGYTCAHQEAITQYRVDADVSTSVLATCTK